MHNHYHRRSQDFGSFFLAKLDDLFSGRLPTLQISLAQQKSPQKFDSCSAWECTYNFPL